MSADPAEVEEWLRQLKESLASMSSPERDNILKEARSHLCERLAAGCTPSAALAGFGSPEDYAQRFVEEMQTGDALRSTDTAAHPPVIANPTNRTFVATLAGVGIAVLGVLSCVAVLLLIAKLFDPVHVGVWRLRPNGLIVGKIRNPAEGADLLGTWLYPFCVGVLALSGMGCRALLLWAARQLAGGRRGVLV